MKTTPRPLSGPAATFRPCRARRSRPSYPRDCRHHGSNAVFQEIIIADSRAQMDEREIAWKKKRFRYAFQSQKLRIRQLRQNEIFTFERTRRSALVWQEDTVFRPPAPQGPLDRTKIMNRGMADCKARRRTPMFDRRFRRPLLYASALGRESFCSKC